MIAAAAAVTLCSCAGGPIERQSWKTGVRLAEWTEIRAAIRETTSSPVTFCARRYGSGGSGDITVTTADGKSYRAHKAGARWHFEEVVIMI